MAYTLRKLFEPRIAVWLGVIAPVLSISFIGVSIALSPWFSWKLNAISDLGVSSVAPIFNSGLILTGILIAIFAVAIARTEREYNFCFKGAVGLFLGGVSVAGIGVFTEAFMRMHIISALSCFACMIASSFLFGICFYMEKKSKLLVVSTLLSGIPTIFIWSLVILSSVVTREPPLWIALLEAVSAVPFAFFYFSLCVRMYMKSLVRKTS